jgi:hypothetical protein
VTVIESNWPSEQVGKKVLIIKGKYENTPALVVGIRGEYDTETKQKIFV